LSLKRFQIHLPELRLVPYPRRSDELILNQPQIPSQKPNRKESTSKSIQSRTRSPHTLEATK
jgi:hypothetical protein